MNREKFRHIFVFLITILIGEFLCLPAIAAEKGTTEKPPKTHIVEKGDTLWDIANKYLKDPFEWRAIWKGNKYIEDPNLIFPGDPVDFVKRKKARLLKKKVTPKRKIVKKVIPPPVSKVPITTLSTLATAGYIVEDERSVGTIFSSPEEKLLLSDGDKVYVDMGKKDVTPGKKFTIYKYIRLVRHPVTNKKIGHLIKIVGELEISEVRKEMSIAFISQSYDVITRGDRLLEYQEIKVPMVDPRAEPEKKDINGYIIETKDHKMNVGKRDVVYIDSGFEEGISPGDIFVAYHKGDTIERNFAKNLQLPNIIIGELRVIYVREKTSTAMITKSTDALTIGNRIEYKYRR
ncbi:MAG: LysM peptidoglycan-binding domain-containing protein [Nitrospinota bacterium]